MDPAFRIPKREQNFRCCSNKGLSKELLCTDQPFPDSHTVRAADNAVGAVGAANASDALRQGLEAFPGFQKIPFKVVVGEEAEFVRDRHALRARWTARPS